MCHSRKALQKGLYINWVHMKKRAGRTEASEQASPRRPQLLFPAGRIAEAALPSSYALLCCCGMEDPVVGVTRSC